MPKLFLIPLLMAGIALAANAQNTSQTTHEETVVRSTYAKLSFAAQQVPIAQLAIEATGLRTPKQFVGLSKEQRIAKGQVTIKLADFTVGSLEDIQHRRVTDLITPAVGERLDFEQGRSSYILDGKEYQWFDLRPAWKPARPEDEVANLSLQDFIALQWQQGSPPFQTFASYSVAVTYQGKTIGPYGALFLFGKDKGTEYVQPEDGTIDATALAAVMHEHLSADAFTTERFHATLVIKEWMAHHSPDCSNSEDQGVCCDLAQMVCEPSHKGGAQ